MTNPDGTEYLPSFAPQWMTQWRAAAARLDELHRDELQSMTEADAARIFAQLDPLRPYELRPTSGLIEQQRWFGLVRDKMAREEMARKDRQRSRSDVTPG